MFGENNSSETTQLCVESALCGGEVATRRTWVELLEISREEKPEYFYYNSQSHQREAQTKMGGGTLQIIITMLTQTHLLKHITTSHAYTHIYKVTEGQE